MDNYLNPSKVLIADDEASITNSIAYALEREGYVVKRSYDGQEVLKQIDDFQPDILILDIMMPYFNGYEVCRRISPDSNMGILMLTAKNDLMDKVIGLELGADDYMTKPFDLVELLARVNSLSRRLKKSKGSSVSKQNIISQYTSEGIEIKVLQRLVYVDGEHIDFKPKEFDLLVFLVKNCGRVFTREQILENIWNIDYFGGTRTIDIHIQRIRKKLGSYSSIVRTVPKIGYKVVDFKGVVI